TLVMAGGGPLTPPKVLARLLYLLIFLSTPPQCRGFFYSYKFNVKSATPPRQKKFIKKKRPIPT
ncbi:hypothetical protein, partial [Enterobacter hormaechei]